MKIKTVCDITGLTDRTIRYYIEEGLISPAYTENYLGRKSFDFTEADVQQLKDISVLRKFGFSIAEIKEMYSDPAQISPIVKSLRQRKQIIIDEENSLLEVLLQLDENHRYSLSELAECLSTPVTHEPLPPEDTAFKIGLSIRRFAKAFLLGSVTWLPIVLSALAAIASIHAQTYPVLNWKAFVFLLIALSPSVFMLLRSKLKLRRPRYKKSLAFLCILSIPVSFFCAAAITPLSETSDIRNYRKLDPDCLANRSPFYNELFPTWSHTAISKQLPDGSFETVYLDTHYLYRNLPAIDYTYDIYAQWPLEKEAFYEEVTRVKALYESSATEYTRKYEIVQKGNYTCLFAYVGNPPFEEVTDSYIYYIFAYDEQNLTVRYILCDSLENGADQPYYMSLDW